MKRGPATFTLILGLIALALLIALSLAGFLSLRTGTRAISDRYGALAAATALAADELYARDDAGSQATLARLRRVGVYFTSDSPPRQASRPMFAALADNIGTMLGDPSRVVVGMSPEPLIWVRSARAPGRWIVMQATSYRQEVIDSIVLAMLSAGIVALIAAALAARLLTRPLERLAGNAGALLHGEAGVELPAGSPREVRSLATALAEAAARLRAAARERELMLAGISHDLRTPLARLRVALELGDAADPKRLAAMTDDLDQLDGALEQCLAFVRDGRDETPREIDLAALAWQLVGLRAQPEAWHVDAPPTLRAVLRATLVRRALANLIDNAERYGTAPFEMTLWRDGGDVNIAIADRGAGVTPALLGRLGEPFLRGDPARGGNGSGLGLSIVTRIAKLHDGALDLRNREGGGFEARLRLQAEWPQPSR